MQPRKISPQSPSIEDETKIKNQVQSTSNSDIPTDSGELSNVEKARYCWGATEILNSKDPPSEDIWETCLTDADNPEEITLELTRPNRSPPYR